VFLSNLGAAVDYRYQIALQAAISGKIENIE
jgi:hypothetical protein